MYFSKNVVVRFLPNRNLLFIDDLPPIRSEVVVDASTLHETQEVNLCTAEVTPLVADSIQGLVFFNHLLYFLLSNKISTKNVSNTD